ncbi:protein SLOW WALKER 2-like [Actinidia eriantha]|uniref:protein SLOW WALKER 2-like n=1 Tax=Actinidia eriantha TaxID=165200 RepID=UPI00259107C1|nr:protein SLOW WALKER 2-like [Actinidia eriantha]
MAISKSKKPEHGEDIDLLKSDVASFASSIGLSSAAPSSGFDDSDFRKTGPLKPRNKQHPPPNKSPKQPKSNDEAKTDLKKNQKNNNSKERPKPSVLQPLSANNSKGFDKFKNLPLLPLVKARSLGAWHMDAAELEKKVIGGDSKKKVELRDVEEWKRLVAKKKELAERLLAQYTQDYEASRGQSGDVKMLMATQRSGTATDKVSAFSVMVGENPIANLRSLDALLGMVTSKVGKRHALTGFEALKELFISSLLPDRKLKTLFQQHINHLPESKDGYSLLLFWHWEECLKQRYERFIAAIEEASRDMLPILKDKALKTIYTLLRSKSEQERRLLSALVNKIGDPENKAASNADFHLSRLLTDHPNMKAVVIDEVDTFLFRPHLALRAKYHAVNFLSQIRLSHKGDGPKVAKRLIDVYFALFKVLISETDESGKTDKNRKEEDRKASTPSKDSKLKRQSSESHVEMDSRLLSALLTGVNRAFPFVSSDEADDIIEVQTPMLFQLVHSKNFNVGVQALMLLDKISSKNQIVSDRFYRALYSKLLLPAAMNSSKAKMFIGLVLRALKNDINLKRVSAFSKRLLQVALQQPPQYACGCLFLLSEVLKARPPLWHMVLQDESVNEDFEHFEDIVEETVNHKITKLKEPDKARETVSACDSIDTASDSSEDEDASPASDSESDASDEADDLLVRGALEGVKEAKSIVGRTGDQPQVPDIRTLLPGGYNPRHREPSYCNADHVSWWELKILASHVHPSVATMARTLLSGANIVYNGNPLNDLSLPAFLDKLMEKKPKQSTWHGGSQIEPSKKLDMNNQLIGPEILSLAEMDVPPEDLVFHKFYMNKMSSSKKPKKKKKKKGAEDEAAEELFAAGDDESDNEEIENMLDSANPSLEAGGDYDYDDLDQVAIEDDDDDLVGNVSDEEIDVPSDIAEGEDDYDDINSNFTDDNDVDVGDADDGSEEEPVFEQRNRKRKSGLQTAASPFASLEEYEHLLDEQTPTRSKSAKGKNSTSKKRRKKSKSISSSS